MTNPPCPICQGPTHAHGHTKAGTPRYLCLLCGKSFTGGKRGRKAIGDRAMTEAEKKRRQRQLKKDQDKG